MRGFRGKGLVYQRTGVTADDRTKLDLVRQGLGLALLERTEAQAEMDVGNVVVLSTESITTNLSFGYLTSKATDPLIRALRAAVFSAFGVIRELPAAGAQTLA